jgi:ABC-type sugar transport system ATPase subunit
MAPVILWLRSSKSFRAPVLGPVELTLGRREIVVLVGPSGCGATTLLRIVAG